MAKRRRVANLLALAVLSALVERPMHPYEIATVLRERGKEQDMRIKWGSLYTVVQNLERHGLIDVAESGRQGGRPERTVYRITDAGRTELRDWTAELVGTVETEQSRFVAGLSVLGVLPPDEAGALLGDRSARLDERVAEQREVLESSHRAGVPRLFLVEAEYELAMREAEAAWVRSFRDELRTGSLPGMDVWRAWHAAGEAPPEDATRPGAMPGGGAAGEN